MNNNEKYTNNKVKLMIYIISKCALFKFVQNLILLRKLVMSN